MVRNSVEVLINEVKYEFCVNVGSMMHIEKTSGKSFMAVLKKAEKGELLALTILLGSCLRKDGKPVGTEFIENLYLDELEELMNPLMEAIANAFPQNDGKEKNVKTVQKMMK